MSSESLQQSRNWERALGRAWSSRLEVVAAARPPARSPALPTGSLDCGSLPSWRAWLCAMVPVACPCRGGN